MLDAVYKKVSDTELSRRQQATLKLLKKNKADAMVIYNYGDVLAGPYKWLTDNSHYYGVCALLTNDCIVMMNTGDTLPNDYKMTLVKKGEKQLPWLNWSVPYTPGVTYTAYKYGEQLATYIKNNNFKRIAWGGLSYASASLYKYLTENLDVEFIDLSSQLDEIRLVKSKEELEGYKLSVDIQDRLIAYAYSSIRPKLTRRQLTSEMLGRACSLSAVEFDTSFIRAWRDDQELGIDDPFEIGDYIYVLAEVAGPSGEWAECGRLFRLGKEPEKKWIDLSNKVIKVQHYIASLCVPGAICEDIYLKCRAYEKKLGLIEEARRCGHGQGLDIVDGPSLAQGEKTPLKAGMFMAIHPSYQHEQGSSNAPYFSYTDNYVIEKNGAKRLSSTEQKIFTIKV